MCLLHPEEYRQFSYRNNKDDISNKLKEDFIIGIENAFKYRKTIRFTTHKWFYENILLDEKIKARYDIEKEEKGKIKIATEVISLFSVKEILENKMYALNTATRKRKKYCVTLKRKGKVDFRLN